MTIDQIVPILQLAIGPVIVISGAGLVLLSMTNRFGRVIDRARILAESMHSGSDGDSHHIQSQLLILTRRARMLRLAIAFTSVSLLLAGFLVIVLFVLALMDLKTAYVIIVIFILCMGSLIAGLVVFIADVNVSLSALKLEIDVEKR